MATQASVPRIELAIRAVLRNTGVGSVTPNCSMDVDLSQSLTNGTTSGRADLVHAMRYTVVDSATPVALNLADGSLLDIYGAPCAFKEITTILARNRNTAAADVVLVGQNDSGDLTGDLIQPGGMIFKHQPADPANTITIGDNDTLSLVAIGSAANVQVDLWLIGRSA